MDANQKLFQAVDLCCDLKCGISALFAICTALEDEYPSTRSYADGLHFISLRLYEKQEELRKLLEV